jgi:hypothetical protein
VAQLPFWGAAGAKDAVAEGGPVGSRTSDLYVSVPPEAGGITRLVGNRGVGRYSVPATVRVSVEVDPSGILCAVTPDDAAAIRAVAARFGRGEGGTLEMCSSLRGSLHDVCGADPLEGDFFRLFTALESWDVATGTDRESAAETARTIARHLGRGA